MVRQVSGYIAASPLTRNEAQRQMMAEALIWETLLLFDAQRQAREQGKAEALQQMAQSARATMLKRGMDLGSMDLTPRGFQYPETGLTRRPDRLDVELTVTDADGNVRVQTFEYDNRRPER